jgi:hypothetical protein
MTAALIPAAVLRDLRRRRGLREFTWRMCLSCKEQFRSTGADHRVCEPCRIARKAYRMEFV